MPNIYKRWKQHHAVMHLTTAEVPTTASDKWPPRIQMIRHILPAALSKFHLCCELPGSEMYPNTTWLMKSYSKMSLKTSTARTNPQILTSKESFSLQWLCTFTLRVFFPREVNSSDRFHRVFRFISTNTEPLSEKWPTSHFLWKKSAEHHLRVLGHASLTLRNSSSQRGLRHCVTSETWKNRKWRRHWDKNRHYSFARILFQTKPFKII